jgi:hypothetical protein
MRGFMCRLLCAVFGLGFMLGARRGRLGWRGPFWLFREGHEGGPAHHHDGGGVLGADPEKRRRFRRRLREALDELLADEPQQPGPAQGQPTA